MITSLKRDWVVYLSETVQIERSLVSPEVAIVKVRNCPSAKQAVVEAMSWADDQGLQGVVVSGIDCTEIMQATVENKDEAVK